ncbi:MAG: YHS domain-containing protein [Phycisphaerae bacterium]|nr:YHS domain-containing protein [Phycisphaerae bacterium]
MEGRAVDKSIFVEYKGVKVYFCCEGCKPDFEANPEKYLAKLPQFKK